MISFLEVLERAGTGPIMSAKEFDMKVVIPNVRQVVKKYKITYDPDSPCSCDDDLAGTHSLTSSGTTPLANISSRTNRFGTLP